MKVIYPNRIVGGERVSCDVFPFAEDTEGNSFGSHIDVQLHSMGNGLFYRLNGLGQAE